MIYIDKILRYMHIIASLCSTLLDLSLAITKNWTQEKCLRKRGETYENPGSFLFLLSFLIKFLCIFLFAAASGFVVA